MVTGWPLDVTGMASTATSALSAAAKDHGRSGRDICVSPSTCSRPKAARGRDSGTTADSKTHAASIDPPRPTSAPPVALAGGGGAQTPCGATLHLPSDLRWGRRAFLGAAAELRGGFRSFAGDRGVPDLLLAPADDEQDG